MPTQSSGRAGVAGWWATSGSMATGTGTDIGGSLGNAGEAAPAWACGSVLAAWRSNRTNRGRIVAAGIGPAARRHATQRRTARRRCAPVQPRAARQLRQSRCSGCAPAGPCDRRRPAPAGAGPGSTTGAAASIQCAPVRPRAGRAPRPAAPVPVPPCPLPQAGTTAAQRPARFRPDGPPAPAPPRPPWRGPGRRALQFRLRPLPRRRAPGRRKPRPRRPAGHAHRSAPAAPRPIGPMPPAPVRAAVRADAASDARPSRAARWPTSPTWRRPAADRRRR